MLTKSVCPPFSLFWPWLINDRDLASYQEAMASYAIPAVNDRFDMLRQLGNSFIVQPNVLKSYMTEGHLGRIDPRLLKPYLAQRSDYSQFSRSLNLEDGPAATSADEPTATPNANANAPVFAGPSSGSAGGATNTSDAGVVGHMGGMSTGSKLKGSRLSTMSGVAGVGMGKLREMLKEFEALSPEEAAAAAKRDRERERDRARAGAPGTGGSARGAMPAPAYIPMRM